MKDHTTTPNQRQTTKKLKRMPASLNLLQDILEEENNKNSIEVLVTGEIIIEEQYPGCVCVIL